MIHFKTDSNSDCQMSIFRYNVFILDPENHLINHNGQISYRDGSICDHTVIGISLTNDEIIARYLNADTGRPYFESRCARPDDWREVDSRVLWRCFNMLKYASHFYYTFKKNKIFLIIRNPKFKAVFEKLLENDKFKCRHIWIPDMIVPGYVAVTQL